MAILLYPDCTVDVVSLPRFTRSVLETFVEGPLNHISNDDGKIRMVSNLNSMLHGLEFNHSASRLATSIMGTEFYLSGIVIYFMEEDIVELI